MPYARLPYRLAAAAALALVVALEATPARAQQDNTAAVEALFSDGKKLMAAGKVAEACPKFLASYTLEHRVGTLLNLAACYEKNGQLASAWGRFVEAKTLAARANQADRATFAAQHAAALEPRRSSLTITVNQPAPGLVVKRDGVVVDPAVFGIAVPVDSGPHAVEASAPDKKPVTESIVVKTEQDAKTYVLPPLLDEPHAPAGVAVNEGGASAGVLGSGGQTSAPPAATHSSTRMVVGLGVAGLGVIAAGIGAVFVVEALSKNSSSNANGECTGNLCNGAGFADRNTARSDGNISSVLIGVGAAAIVGGVVVWLTAPKGEAATSSHVVIGMGPTGLDVRGVF
jgi:hypothetical protein